MNGQIIGSEAAQGKAAEVQSFFIRDLMVGEAIDQLFDEPLGCGQVRDIQHGVEGCGGIPGVWGKSVPGTIARTLGKNDNGRKLFADGVL